MKLLMTHPFYWPYVRRGAERYIHELSDYLAHQGYQVEIVTSKPGQSKTIIRNGLKVHYWRQFLNPLHVRFGIKPEFSFMPTAFWSLAQEKYDLIHSFYPSDGYAAHLYKKFKPIKYVLNFNGPPIRAIYRKVPLLHYLMKKSFESASIIIVNSKFAHKYLKEDWGKDGVVIPGAVNVSNFFVTKWKNLDCPTILCTAAIDQPYKNIPLLVKAFERFKSKVPNAILQLSGHFDLESARRLILSVNLRTRESIHFLGVGKVKNLPRLYSEAAFCVLPSINESFGMVLLESLASGTPVVGTESGGIPEIISDPEIGVLYKPDMTDSPPTNVIDLCDAMLRALELAHNPETSGRCLNHARQYDWSVVGPLFENVYEKALN